MTIEQIIHNEINKIDENSQVRSGWAIAYALLQIANILKELKNINVTNKPTWRGQ